VTTTDQTAPRTVLGFLSQLGRPRTGPPGDLTHLYPAGWSWCFVVDGDQADGSARVAFCDRETAEQFALQAVERVEARMRVFRDADGGWAYQPAAVARAQRRTGRHSWPRDLISLSGTWGPAAAKPPAREVVLALYGTVAQTWCAHAPAEPRSPRSDVDSARRTCDWEHNGLTWSPAAVEQAHAAADEHARAVGHTVDVLEIARTHRFPRSGAR